MPNSKFGIPLQLIQFLKSFQVHMVPIPSTHLSRSMILRAERLATGVAV